MRARFQHHSLAALQASSADFRALQVLENTQRSSQPFGGTAQAFDPLLMLGMGPVRKIKAGNVHTELHQIANAAFGIRRRSDGADNLCPPNPRGRTVGKIESRQNSGDEIGLAWQQVAESFVTRLRDFFSADQRGRT